MLRLALTLIALTATGCIAAEDLSPGAADDLGLVVLEDLESNVTEFEGEVLLPRTARGRSLPIVPPGSTAAHEVALPEGARIVLLNLTWTPGPENGRLTFVVVDAEGHTVASGRHAGDGEAGTRLRVTHLVASPLTVRVENLWSAPADYLLRVELLS